MRKHYSKLHFGDEKPTANRLQLNARGSFKLCEILQYQKQGQLYMQFIISINMQKGRNAIRLRPFLIPRHAINIILKSSRN
jgi:hypothetical protein